MRGRLWSAGLVLWAPGLAHAGGVELVASEVFAGRTATLSVTGAAPGQAVGFVLSGRPAGQGPCWVALGGPCLDLVRPVQVGVVIADAQGDAVLSVPVPFDEPARTYLAQAALLQPGGPGVSNVVAVEVVPRAADTDGDGARDVIEAELGLDRFDPDTDGDGVLDGVDITPLVAGPAPVYVIDDQTVSDPAGSLPDPEYDRVTGQFVWQDMEGREVWVGTVDASTGQLVPPDGRGVLVTTDISTIGLGQNGPEWVHTARGPEVLYIDDVAGTWRVFTAWYDGVAWQAAPIPDAPFAEVVFGTQIPGDPTPRLTYQRTTGPSPSGFRWLNDPSTQVDLPFQLVDARWLEDQPVMISTGVPSPGAARQIAWVDPVARTARPLTSDATDKYDVKAWYAPEWGGEVAMIVSRGVAEREFTEVAVYREIAGVWTVVKSIRPPPGQPYVISPEVFTWAGRSYVSFLASTRPENKDNGEASVWFAATDPADPTLRRVSEDVVRVRKDPEPYTGGVRPWVFYTVVRGSGERVIRRTELGL